MDDSFIVSAYCIISDTLEAFDHQTHKLARVNDAEILTVAVVAAKFFGNHQKRALDLLHKWQISFIKSREHRSKTDLCKRSIMSYGQDRLHPSFERVSL